MEWVETGELLMTGLWPGVHFPWGVVARVPRVPPDASLHAACGCACPWRDLWMACATISLQRTRLCSDPYKYIFTYLLSAVMERGGKGPRLLAAMIPWMSEEPLSLLAESPGGSASSSGLLLPWTSLPRQCSSRVCMALTKELLLISVN